MNERILISYGTVTGNAEICTAWAESVVAALKTASPSKAAAVVCTNT